MRKTAKKRTTKRSGASPSKRPKAKKAGEKGAPTAVRSCTKQSAAIDMLRSTGGATITALTKATGWQPHSVRGFLSGVVKKKLKLKIESRKDGNDRTYRIKGRASS